MEKKITPYYAVMLKKEGEIQFYGKEYSKDFVYGLVKSLLDAKAGEEIFYAEGVTDLYHNGADVEDYPWVKILNDKPQVNAVSLMAVCSLHPDEANQCMKSALKRVMYLMQITQGLHPEEGESDENYQ